MTRAAGGTFERLGVMISADLARRLDNAAWRASTPTVPVSRGDVITYALREFVAASETGEPFDNPEGLNP